MPSAGQPRLRETDASTVALENAPSVLCLNGGSSSVRFALYGLDSSPTALLRGKIDRIGLQNTRITFEDFRHEQKGTDVIGDFDHASAANFLVKWLDEQLVFGSVSAIGHRIVNGGWRYKEPQPVTADMVDEIRRVSAYAPEHLPSELALVELFGKRLPGLLQVACFDTAFHREMPQVAKILPLPRKYREQGVERYGFHGLSFEYLMDELARTAGADAAQGRVILAHLGNGSSLAAVHNGKGIDTSMGFTPAAGVPMGTRSGDLDPGLVWYFAQTEQMSSKQFHQMVNHQSGLLGVSGTSSDFRELLQQTDDVRAAEAIELFCYQVKKFVGAYSAALGGLDTLIFTGGVGENAPAVRERICSGLDFLGINVEKSRNDSNAKIISAEGASVTVHVMRTDEELMIAKATGRIFTGNRSRSTQGLDP